MKVQYECMSCILRQAIEAAQMVTDNEKIIDEIIEEYAKRIPEIRNNLSTPLVVSQIQQSIKEKTNNSDPYQDFKEKNMKLAQNIYEDLEELIQRDKNPLKKALIISATGNVIDAGISLKIEVEDSILKSIKKGLVVDHYQKFADHLKTADSLLIIGDNTGEAVLDKLLLKELDSYDINITYAVRDIPILNDVTLKEAEEIGLSQYAKVISSGCKAPGMLIEQANDNFMNLYNKADIVLSKGQGNLEGLSEEDRPIFYLLKAKCDLIADWLDVTLNDLVFKFVK